jgi:hypothetical protein
MAGDREEDTQLLVLPATAPGASTPLVWRSGMGRGAMEEWSGGAEWEESSGGVEAASRGGGTSHGGGVIDADRSGEGERKKRVGRRKK